MNVSFFILFLTDVPGVDGEQGQFDIGHNSTDKT